MHNNANKKRVILISGCSRGLGRELLHAMNGFTCICINRKKHSDQDLIMDLGAPDIDINAIQDLITAYDEIIYINNASAIAPVEEIRKTRQNDLEYATNVNFLNPAKIILSILQSNNSYIIINITTGAAFTTNSQLGIYSSTKAAMHRYIEILREEEAANPKALLITNYDPGRMQTDMQRTLIAGKALEDDFNDLNKPSEIANVLSAMIKKELYEKC